MNSCEHASAENAGGRIHQRMHQLMNCPPHQFRLSRMKSNTGRLWAQASAQVARTAAEARRLRRD